MGSFVAWLIGFQMKNSFIKIARSKVFWVLIFCGLIVLMAGSVIIVLQRASETEAVVSSTSQSSEAFYRLAKDKYAQEGFFAGLKQFAPDFDLANYRIVYVGEKAVVWVLSSEQPEAYAEQGKAIEEGISKVEYYFKTTIGERFKGEKKIHFLYGATDVAHVLVPVYDRPVVLMPLKYDQYSFRSYVHETVHLFSGCKHFRWLEEGLAVYLNDKLGGGGNFPNDGYDIDRLARLYGEEKPVIEWVGAGYNHQIDVKTYDGKLFYVYSGSFVKYLVENMGIDFFLEALSQDDVLKAIKSETNKDIAQWKKEWVELVLSEN